MRKIIVDGVALALYAVVSLPMLTGVAAHEWLGLAVLVVLFAHGVQHYDFVAVVLRPSASSRAARGGASRKEAGSGVSRGIGRLVLDAGLLLALTATVLSGLMESGAVLPALGWYAEGYFVWAPLHAAAAKVLLALIVVHLALNGAAAWHSVVRSRGASHPCGDGAPDEGVA